MIGREGTAKKSGRLPPVPSFRGRLVKRADMRARIELDHDKDFVALNAASGVLLLIEADFSDGFEVVAAEVYAVHPAYRYLDVQLRASLPANANRVEVKRTSLGVIP